jgi:predicted porin
MKKLALASMVAAAAAVAAPAQAVTVMAEDGWTLGVSGSVNQFAVFTENDNGDDISEVRDGLLPAFINFDMTAPTMNGLDMAAHISFSPSTNTDSYGSTATLGGSGLEQREVYFTVDGSFGQVLMGKALGLYGSHNILTEQTLFGVGYGTGGNGQTTLGGIGLGYDYASWRSQIRYTTPDMNGFKAAVAVVDSAGPGLFLSGKPTGSIISGGDITNGATDSDDLRYEADLSYAGSFDGGSFMAWASGAFQTHDDLAEDARYWTVGSTLKLGGFEFMAQYSDAEDSVEDPLGQTAALSASPLVNGTAKAEWNQYVVQAGYRFAGTTLVSVNYSELEDDSSSADRAARYGDSGDDAIERWTVGVYHDVNSNLKLVAEYTGVEDDVDDGLDQDIFAIGGFFFF